jgi:DnaJ-class molecular chaperone
MKTLDEILNSPDPKLRKEKYIFKNSKKYGKCSKCNGSGRLPIYNHICGGKCFKCNGSGKVLINI